jgi:type IV pilus assembly protein PilY1
MINYLRGDSSLEQKNAGGTYRNRDTPVGDIVDSQPVYVGAPDPNQFYNQTFAGSSTFSAYASTNASRTPLIYVAANDGMLHALNANTGAETYAYIPGAVITSGLSQLADPDYGTSVPHQFFNDGELTVADVYFGSPSAWHTVAVGTTGRGSARAVYALDITDPANIQFLWERSAGDGQVNSNYIGQMTGKPVIAQVASGSWSVLIGNGYNSAAGVAALLQFNLTDGTLTTHLTTDTSTDNGLAAPAIWLDDPSNGISTYAYAGDRHGQVWSFTLNNGTSSTPTGAGSLF